MTDPFAAPASTSGIDLNTVLGSLLVITVHSQEMGVNTVHGVANPIRADVAVLDGDHKGEDYPDVLLFPRVLITQLRSRIGQKVLGRLGRGSARVAGQDPPWTLAEATEADKAVGVAYLGGLVSTPATDPNDPPW